MLGLRLTSAVSVRRCGRKLMYRKRMAKKYIYCSGYAAVTYILVLGVRGVGLDECRCWWVWVGGSAGFGE